MRVLLTLVLLLSWPVAGPSDEAPRILVVGDSISAGHGVPADAGWVTRLRGRLDAEGYRYEVVNASVGGDTTSGGLARLPDALTRHDPEVVVLELGGNDGLRGLPPDAMEANLRRMIERARAAGARPLLLGIRLPPNYGPAYGERFTAVYRRVAEGTGVPLVPRLLDGVGDRAETMQPDGIHPNAEGHARILENVWPTLEPILRESTAARSRRSRSAGLRPTPRRAGAAALAGRRARGAPAAAPPATRPRCG